MINFTEEIINILNGYLSKSEEYVESIQLASYGFNIQFVNFSVQCSERLFSQIAGETYEWQDAPNSGPWGALVRQVAKEAKLKAPNLLSITFESGDSIDIETIAGQYESVIFTFPPEGDSLVMEIF